MSGETAPVPLLLVDDLAENLISLEALLKRDDLLLLKARSGEEALELLLVHDVALALLDVQMPGMNGFELAEFLRGSERTRHIPIIFVTAGTADAQRRFRGYEAGAVDFIQKPIEADILRSKAEVFIDLYQQRQQIAAQRDALDAAAKALKAADRRKDEFLAILAHELRNPVTALNAGIHLLKKHVTTDRAVMVREKMEGQLTHLSRLIEDLLDISRITEGKVSLQKERIQLATIVRTAVEASQTHIDNGGHAFSIDIPDKAVWLDADHTRMAQIVSNLLNNAAKYTPDGGTIVLSGHEIGDRCEIAVADNGVGIPADRQAQIFDMFAQLQDHHAQSSTGLGIGLALVRQLVQLHGGSIAVESEGRGKGSTFTVSVPLAGDEG
jgi:signal transduction histidine kinase